MISRLLIANRGEIACRIIKTAREMGIATIAVYSDADQHARHVRLADQAVRIGGGPPAESYLCGERIIDAALKAGADAVHPGYGFLSENPDFVDMVTSAGLVFVGPSAHAIRAMGLKDKAKALMIKVGVPVVPGYHGADQDDDTLANQAAEIGYPVLIKAVAGGGGKGMRLVETATDFLSALNGARNEAQSSFGTSAVLIEKYISSPRHIEVQVFGDGTNVIHLFERDCSLQRRHQKVVEEAPAPGMTAEVRDAMTAAAITAAKAINYSGAGTIEFIVDGSGPLRSDGFWFMEMNTRLQVEHPVTEAITGIDLVAWQLKVAGGERLPLLQKDIKISGHAIEARVYAEDPSCDFLPAAGRLDHIVFPPELRADSGVEAGDAISTFYDPMIAKLVAFGADRHAALAQMQKGLAATEIAGTVTNIGFLSALVSHEKFVGGEFDTTLIARNLETLSKAGSPTTSDFATAAVRLSRMGRVGRMGFSLHAPLTWTVGISGEVVAMTPRGIDVIDCVVGDTLVPVRRYDRDWHADGDIRRPYHVTKNQITFFGPSTFTLSLTNQLDRVIELAAFDDILAPMPGQLRELLVEVGEQVSQGQGLAILEAMKMEHILKAPRDGVIASIACKVGDQVGANAVLITLEEQEGL